jgi:hypothetical protein
VVPVNNQETTMVNLNNASTSTFANNNNAEVNKMNRKSLVAFLIESGMYNKEVRVIERVDITRTPATKNTKAKVKRTVVYSNTTKTVVDTNALNQGIKEAMKGITIPEVIHEAKKAKTVKTNNLKVEDVQRSAREKAQAELQRRQAQAHIAKLAHRVGEIAKLDAQIDRLQSTKIRKASAVNPVVKKVKIGAPSAGAIRNARRVARGVKQAKRMVALATIAKYTKPSTYTPITSAMNIYTPNSFGNNTITSIKHYPQINMMAESSERMDIDDILIAVHNQAVDDFSTQGNAELTASAYEEAVLDCYEEVARQLNITLTDNEEEEIFHMAANFQNHYTFNQVNSNKVRAFWNGIDVAEAINHYNEVMTALNEEAKTYGGDLRDDLSNTVYEWKKDILTVEDYLIFEKAIGYTGDVALLMSEDAMNNKDILSMSLNEFEHGVYNLDLSESVLGGNFMNADNTEFYLIGSPTTGGGDNLDKNSVINNTHVNEEIPMDTNIAAKNMTTFMKAFLATMIHPEVAPIINYGIIANKVVNFDGVGTSLAEVFAGIIYKHDESKRQSFHSDEKWAEREIQIARINARVDENRQAFLDQFSGKLGHVVNATINYEARDDFNRFTGEKTRLNLEALFTLALHPAEGDEEGTITYTGRTKAVNSLEFSGKYVSGAILFASILAKATAGLNAEERAQLLGVLFHEVARVEGTVISRNGVSIDLAKATVTTSTRELQANKASCFGKIGNEFIVLDGPQSIFLFAMQALGGTAKQLETSINLAVKLFVPEHTYGHKPDSDDIAHYVRTNFIYTNKVKDAYNNFPSFQILGGKQDPDFLSYVLSRGIIAASDKTNVKFVTIGLGAEATGIGWNRETNIMMTSNDVNKPSKLINRGAANNYDCADLPNRVASKFGFLLSDGQVARTKGALKKTAYTNSILLTAGSGNATINPKSTFTYSVDKKEKSPFHFSLLGAAALNNPKVQGAFIEGLMNKMNSLRGEQFEPGAVIASVNGIDLIRNSEVAATVELINTTIKRSVIDENEIEIIAHVRMMGESQFVKTRRFATKFTTTPYAVKGLSQEWEIILNNECTKGQGALLEMFANATGERYVNNSTGEFVTPEGDVINLLEENNAFQQWKESNAKQETITVTIAKSVFNNIKRFAESEFTVISETATTVTVSETVTVIYGELVYDVEISTPLESISKSNLTLESASAVYLQSPRLGDIFFKEALAKASQYADLANRFAGADKDSLDVIDLDSDEDYGLFIEAVGNVGELTQKQLLLHLSSVFPNGVIFYAGKTELSLNFTVAANFGSFNPVNGSAARENAQIVNFLVDAIENGASNAKSLAVQAKYAFAKILNTAVDSKKVLKKPTRSGKLVYGKVRTGFHPLLNTNDGIPNIVLNENCPIVRFLGVKDGDFVGFARTPMPFLGGARIVLTNLRSVVDVAHALVDPYVWHMLNEGDTDGDGIALINLSAKGIEFTKEEIIALNNSLMGMGGYEFLYGQNVPFADFMSVKDKYGKKDPAGKVTMIASSIKNPDCAKESLIPLTPEVLGDFASRVANHYKTAVGTAYGICSKLIFHAADEAAKGDTPRLQQLIEASLISWRLLYEGLGLSGYSREASQVFSFLNMASVDTKGGITGRAQVSIIADKVDVIFEDKTVFSTRDFCVDAAPIMAEMSAFSDLNVSVEAFDLIIGARTVTRALSKLEGFGKAPSQWWEEVLPGAIKYGTLRRISQGDDRVAELLDIQEEAELEASGEFIAKSLTRWFIETVIVEESFSNSLLGQLTNKVADFHYTLSTAKAINASQQQ